MHPRFSQIDGKLRRGLVKIRTAIQMASANSNSGDETRCREEANNANSGVCCALSLSAVAELRARGVRRERCTIYANYEYAYPVSDTRSAEGVRYLKSGAARSR